jgi:peptidyl-prolyl cis-trans isomerase B (cyclophilin B)
MGYKMKSTGSKLCLLVYCCVVFGATVRAQSKIKATAKPAGQPATAAKVGGTVLSEPWKQLNTKERLVEIVTDHGVMIAKLYDSTPLHRDNFIKLVQQRFYDSLLFHRVIDKFMIQGGDPASKNAADGVQLGNGSAPGNRIPAEFKPYLFHKKGALAAARDDNPQRASSNCQFYIVHGKALTDQELAGFYDSRVKVSNPSFNYSATQREIYKRIGGSPFLDQGYTVFGEVISGLDVIDKIATLPKDGANRPLTNTRMRIRLLN